MAATIQGVRASLATVTHARDTNAGLWHDVFLPVFRGAGEGAADARRSDAPAAGEVLRTHLEVTAGTGIPEGYARAFREREVLLRALQGGVEDGRTRCFKASVRGRMVVGLGAQAVAETSVALLRAWGVPYIPGSALKGLASSVAHRRGGETWRRAEVGVPGGEDARALFGDTKAQGLVAFHDAWWMPDGGAVPLDLDVMTVHHPDYYGGSSAPADWDEPNPVPFLTARGSYLVALSGPSGWVEAARAWLEAGLRDDGIGAKTHAGYGRMALEEYLSGEERAARQLADSLADLPAQHRGAVTARQHVERLRDALSKGADLAGVARVARALYEREPGFWQKWLKAPERTDAEREFIARVSMAPEAPPAAVVAPVVAAAVPAQVEVPWQPARAWLATVKNRPTVFARVGDRKVEREARHLELDDALRAALEGATEKAPVEVEAQVRGKDKLAGVRATRKEG